ncbi:hypothetical protein [Phenylobacterium sp.]|jgi:hypothetical protein|uniref:hypothetical protein n=1 Tax=Phenylobacterium sp. TaxID=1871053 RepID=UPI002F92DDA7
MLRRPLILAAAALLAATSAAASGAPEKPSKEVGQYVDVSPVGLPIVVNGQLVNYVFVYVRINLTSGANPSKWREREPYFRDALVRAGHRTPFTLADDYQHIDAARLSATLSRDAAAITGPGVVKSVVVSSQAPRWRARSPRQQAAAKR